MRSRAARNVLAGAVLLCATLAASSALGPVAGEADPGAAERRAFVIERFTLSQGETHALKRDILPGTRMAITGRINYSHPGPPPEGQIRGYDAFYDIYDDGQLGTDHVVVLYDGGPGLGAGLSAYLDGPDTDGNGPAYSSVNEYDVTLDTVLPDARVRHATYTGPSGSTAGGSLRFRVAIPVPDPTKLAYRLEARSEPKVGRQATRDEELRRVRVRGEGTIKAVINDPRCESAKSVADIEMIVSADAKRGDDRTRLKWSRNCASIKTDGGTFEVAIPLRVTATNLSRCEEEDPGRVQIRDSSSKRGEDALGIRYCGRHMVWRKGPNQRGDPDVGIGEVER